MHAQVAIVVDGGNWPDALLSDVASVTCADFALRTDDLDASLDLVALARTPAG